MVPTVHKFREGLACGARRKHESNHCAHFVLRNEKLLRDRLVKHILGASLGGWVYYLFSMPLGGIRFACSILEFLNRSHTNE